MKRIPLFIFTIATAMVFSTQANAQITLTSSDMPKVGDKLVFGHDTTSSSLSKLTAPILGASIVWDYHTLPTTYRDTDSFVNPSTTPYAGLYPSATVADTVYGSVGYTYFDVTGSSFSILGTVQKLQGYKAGAVFNPPFLQLNLPAIYNTVSGSTSKGTVSPFPVNYPGFDSAKANIVITYNDTIDAWGSLTTPLFGGTTYGTLCQKHYELNIDTVYLKDTTTKSWVMLIAQKSKTYEYRWYANGIGNAVATMTMDTATGKKVTAMEWYDGYPDAINELSLQHNVLVYPNPCTNQVTFHLSQQNASIVYVYDIAGRELSNVAITNGTSTLSTTSYSPGIYIYRITDKSGNVIDNGKFTVAQ